MSNTILDSIDIMEALQKNGQTQEVKKLLKAQNIKTLSQENSVKLANLAWRSGIPELGLKILKPWILPKTLTTPKPLNSQILEYSLCLQGLAGFQESNFYLEKISDHNMLSKKYLYLAFNCIYQWDYISAIPLLEQHLAFLEEDSYEWWIAQINLLASLIFRASYNSSDLEVEDLSILTLIKVLEAKILLTSYEKIIANFFEIKSQYLVIQRKWEEAKHSLELSKKRIKQGLSIEELFYKKGLLLIETKQHLEKNQKIVDLGLVEAWQQLKYTAVSTKKFEMNRECDLYLSLLNFDFDLFLKVYHGTRHNAYKVKLKKMANSFSQDLDLDLEQVLSFGESKLPEDTQFLDCQEGLWNKKLVFKVQSKEFLLLSFLLTDIYMPTPIATIFYSFYPNDHFDFEIAVKRIDQYVYRLRKILVKENIPLEILSENNSFLVQIIGPIQILLNNKDFYSSKTINLMNKFFQREKAEVFTIESLEKTWGLSSRQIRRILSDAIQQNIITKIKIKKKFL